MRKGLMQDYANQIAQMFVGYQIDLVDKFRLASIGQGRIVVDLLDGSTTINDAPSPPLSISGAVRDWYSEALVRDGLEEAFVSHIGILCDFAVTDSSPEAKTERTVKLDCQVTLDAQDGVWTGIGTRSERWRQSHEGPFEEIGDL
jgi:hypothetical protein